MASKIQLRVFVKANGQLIMSRNRRLFEKHVVVSGWDGPCCKVEFY